MILLLDNYDSFTYNLVQSIEQLGARVEVVFSDQISVGGVASLAPDKIVVSPGPGSPRQAGASLEVVRRFAGQIPLLGVCLGHQAIACAFGGRVGPAAAIVHGETSIVYHGDSGLYAGVANPFAAMRYHSLVVDRASLPPCLEVSAWTGEGTIMGVRHREWPVEGVQFHPESILTAEGTKILGNFIES